MAAKESELMISVDAGLFPAGTRLTADDPEVRAHPRSWVPFAAGHRAIFARRAELQREAEAKTEADRAVARAEAIRIGTRPLASDDAVTESAKKNVRESDGGLELVYNESGAVMGTRLSPKGLAARNAALGIGPTSAKTAAERAEALAAARRDGYVVDN